MIRWQSITMWIKNKKDQTDMKGSMMLLNKIRLMQNKDYCFKVENHLNHLISIKINYYFMITGIIKQMGLWGLRNLKILKLKS